MRFQVPAAIVCDGCKRPGDGAVQYTVIPGPQAPMFLPRVILPDKWVATMIHPQLVVANPPAVDPFALNAMDLSREVGAPIEAAFCGACKNKATSERIVGVQRRSLEKSGDPGVVVDTNDTGADEREQERDRARAEADSAAEEAERRAFDERRARELAQAEGVGQ